MFEWHASVAFHGEAKTVDFDQANDVAPMVDFLSGTLKVPRHLQEFIVQLVVFGVKYDLHQLSPVISPLT